MGRLDRILRRAARKPAHVVAFRAAQELRLCVMRQTRGWPRLQARISRWWDADRTARCVQAVGDRPRLIARDAVDALQQAARAGDLEPHGLIGFGRRLRSRDFRVLGATVPRDGEWPWHADWRWGHEWHPSYFRAHDVYERHRQAPYDVKMPWELSRLWFLHPILQVAALAPQDDWADGLVAAIESWERENPLAHSVNWFPMEAAMRLIALTVFLEMAAVVDKRRATPSALLRLIAAHGEFVWRTLEYTDVRGNHYAANLVALHLAGAALEGCYPGAGRWRRYAVARIPPEIALQFSADGVHYEKSLAYHRLVTELFLLSLIVAERSGDPFPADARERIRAACRYSAACTQPGGLTPNVGDNDGARALFFDDADARDHRPLLGLAAAVFADPLLRSAAARMPAALPWYLGRPGVEAWQGLNPEAGARARHFVEGGVVVAHAGANHLWCDVGEVGLAGRGGHGHNDLLSFELMLAGQPIMVDPGCPVYTGDFRLRDLFRSTRAHNTLCVDGEELAPMAGMWQIGPHAVPCEVAVRETGGTVRIRAGHTGYLRLPDPVLHVREIVFDTAGGRFECHDAIRCAGRHRVERFLHLGVGVTVELRGPIALLSAAGRVWTLAWDAVSTAAVAEGWVSFGYGQQVPSSVVVLTTVIDGPAPLQWGIAPGAEQR